MTTKYGYNTTLQDFMDACAKAIADRGEEYVYDKAQFGGHCVYAYQGQPGCLIGDALARLGVPLEVLAEAASANADTLLEDLGFHYVIRNIASEMQDSRQRWGAVLATGQQRAERATG